MGFSQGTATGLLPVFLCVFAGMIPSVTAWSFSDMTDQQKKIAIAVGVGVGVILILIVLGCCCCWCKRRERRKADRFIRQNDEMSIKESNERAERTEERRTASQARADEIRQKYNIPRPSANV
eukprot:comp17170_c0_seq1/m.16027 comp17170_c0_seq1/g.16027  ORF comp17170_c0_seq1/g.16027 comp17170_c0_seq1/m.16027 type:complete len:123 (-) comp17170_c0_seq1:694-1062(-)